MQAGVCDCRHLVGVVSSQRYFPVCRHRAAVCCPQRRPAHTLSRLRCTSQPDHVGTHVQSPNPVPAAPGRCEPISSRLPAQRADVLLQMSASELGDDVHETYPADEDRRHMMTDEDLDTEAGTWTM